MYPYKRIKVSFWINVFFWVFHLVLPILVAAIGRLQIAVSKRNFEKGQAWGLALALGFLFFTWEVTTWPWFCALPPVPPLKTNVTMENHHF